MLVITDIGLNKITKATINNPVILEKFAIGDGGGSEITPEASMTSLVNKRYRGEINSKSVRDNTIELGCIVPAFTEIDTDVTIRELGIFDIEGDLIAIMDITPEVFRPGGGNVLTELTFNVGIQLDNSEVVSISFNSQTFATVDMINKLKQALVESSVGIDKYFNTDNTYKDQDIVQIGVKTYGLAGAIVNIEDYPVAFTNCHAVDRGDGTFMVPEIYDGTIRHIPKGSNRVLGSYEEDAMQKITGNVDSYADGGAYSKAVAFLLQDTNARVGGAFRSGEVFPANTYLRFKGTDDSNNPFVDTGVAVPLLFDNSLVARTSDENRMKNTAGQWYMLLKIDI